MKEIQQGFKRQQEATQGNFYIEALRMLHERLTQREIVLTKKDYLELFLFSLHIVNPQAPIAWARGHHIDAVIVQALLDDAETRLEPHAEELAIMLEELVEPKDPKREVIFAEYDQYHLLHPFAGAPIIFEKPKTPNQEIIARDQKIWSLTQAGLTQEAIAKQLGISRATVTMAIRRLRIGDASYYSGKKDTHLLKENKDTISEEDKGYFIEIVTKLKAQNTSNTKIFHEILERFSLLYGNDKEPNLAEIARLLQISREFTRQMYMAYKKK